MNGFYFGLSHLAGDPLELPQGPLGVPAGPHFENQCTTRQTQGKEEKLQQGVAKSVPMPTYKLTELVDLLFSKSFYKFRGGENR